MKFYSCLIVFLAVVISFENVMCDPIPFKDCGSVGVISSLDITDCSKLPCTFVKGHNYTMRLTFVPKADTPTAKNKVYGIISGVTVPFPIPQEDCCSNGLTCPLKAATSYTEDVSLAVLPIYPEISLYAKITVVDSNANVVVCALFPAKITPAATHGKSLRNLLLSN